MTKKLVSLKFADTYQVDTSDSEASEVVEQVKVAKVEAKQIKCSKSPLPAQKSKKLRLS
jgi:hypothetical protein